MKPEVKGDIAKIRYNELTKIIEQKNYDFRKANTKTLEILIEQEKNGKYIGFDQFFNQIEIDSPVDLVGDWVFIDDYEVKANKNVARFK